MSRTHENVQNELLVLRCQQGDSEALKLLIGKWQARFGGLAWRLTGQREAARDVVQDAWLAIVRGIKRLDDPARFPSWAYRIVANKCADWTRSRAQERQAARQMLDAAARSPDDSLTDRDQGQHVVRLRDALARLPEDQRAILALHYLEDMGVAQIAGVLEVPVGTVKSRLYHARQYLKEVLERVKP